MSYNKLSADPTALVLGILSLVIILLGCCCGFLAVLSLILAIIGLVLANKSLNDFYQNSENYSVQSQKNVYIGKILCIIGIIISGIFILVFAVVMLFYEQNLSELIKNEYYKSKNIEIDIQNDSTKTINNTKKMYHYKDSIYSDSTDASH